MDIEYIFVNYGADLPVEEETLVLDVGMKTVAGVIDHHHPQAEPECTASLIVKYPGLVLDHLTAPPRRIITHRLPDFDSLASIFLSLRLIEMGTVDGSMDKIGWYTKMVDSARLPKKIDLPSTPYSILRALFAGSKKDETGINMDRIREGEKFMRFLYAKSEEGYEIIENRPLFRGIERYERAMHKAENDYFNYLHDVNWASQLSLFLPRVSAPGRKKVDGFIIKNPRSFLLKEWARRDTENSTLKEGFSFLMTNFGNHRYILGVDPERDINLKGLGDLLNEKEKEKRVSQGKEMGFRWYDGNCPFFNFRIIDSPQDGTLLTQPEIVDVLTEFGRSPE